MKPGDLVSRGELIRRLEMRKILILLSLVFSVVACVAPEEEMPILIKQLQTGDRKDKSQAALRIGRIGPPHANKATGALIKLLNDKNPGVQSAAAYALRKIDTPKAKKALDRATKNK